MKKIYKPTSYFLVIALLSILLSSVISFKSFADVPSTQKAVGHSDSWGSLDFDYSWTSHYYTIEDTTGIPASLISQPNYFYTPDGVTFSIYNGSDFIMAILSRGLSIILNPDDAAGFLASFFNAIGPPRFGTTSQNKVEGGVYDGNDNFIGYAVNNINGCYYSGLTGSDRPAVDVPSEDVNSVKSYYDYYNKNNYPDYITVYPPSKEYAKSHSYYYGNNDPSTTVGGNYNQAIYDNFDTIASGKFISRFNFRVSNGILKDTLDFYNFDADYFIVNSSSTPTGMWNNFCQYFELFEGNNELLFSEWYMRPFTSSTVCYFYLDPYDSNHNLVTNGTYYSYSSTNHTFSEATVPSDMYKYMFGYWSATSSTKQNCIYIGDTFTIYKDLLTYNAINVNQTYQPNQYISDSYNDYDTSNDNSVTLTVSNIDNSVSNNSTLYNEASDSYYNYVDNSVVNTENITNNVTNIVNNYYNGGGGDNPDNPDNPDDPDSPVLDRLLQAILNFFESIGKVIATVLTGIIEMFASVLEAIATVTAQVVNMSDFFSSILAWLPEPIPQVLGLGFSICILCAVIAFIRG